MTSGWAVVEVVSITRLHFIVTLPLTWTTVPVSVTVPFVAIVMLLSTIGAAVVCAWTEGPPNTNITSITTTATESVTKVGLNSSRRSFIFTCVFIVVLSFLRSQSKAVGSMSVGATKLTPCGVGFGVGRGRRDGAPPSSISHLKSI